MRTSNAAREQHHFKPRSDLVTKPLHILIVEDDPDICDLVSQYLATNNVTSNAVSTISEMRAYLRGQAPDLIILDLNLPDEDGLVACQSIRASLSTPVVVLTARSDEIDRVIGLEMGADDYVVKPFSPRELLARIKAVMRRTSSTSPAARPTKGFSFEGYQLDLVGRRVLGRIGAQIDVTAAEFDLLHVFCEHPNRLLSRELLIDLTHGRVEGPYARSVDVLVSRLRQKIEKNPRHPEMIVTVRSEGYRFEPAVTPLT